MSGHRLKTVVQQLRGMVRPPEDGVNDAQLLARWLCERDQAAFELIVWRHGPSVLGVCRRLLARSQDAEDAFQATFLVFLRKAHTIGKHASVGSWLYKVAYRVALQARSRSARQKFLDGHDVLVPAPETVDTAAWREVRLVLDEEVNRLPERYRTAFVLCCLQGKTNADAARELGVPTGTVLSRLSRARERLRVRLTRRGLTLTAAVVGSGFAADASASVPAPLVVSTMHAVLLGAGEPAVAAGAISAQAAILTKGALHAMWLSKLQTTTAAVLITVLIGGGSVTAYQKLAAGQDDPKPALTKAQDAPARPQARRQSQAGDEKPTTIDRLRNELARTRRDLRAMQDQANERLKLLKFANAQIETLDAQVKKLEAELMARQSFTDTGTALESTNKRTTTTASAPSPRNIASTAVSSSTVKDAETEVAILRAQLDAKEAELRGAKVDYQLAQGTVARAKKLLETHAVDESTVDTFYATLAKAQVGVRVKEAEVMEQRARLAQAVTRAARLQQLGGSSAASAETPRQQEIRRIRADLKRLQQRVDALEKGTGK